jgi:large subunit ribosomal protein L19e
MDLKVQKRLAAHLLKCSPKRICFDENSLEDIKEAITKRDIRGLIKDGIIVKKQALNVSQSRTRKRKIQKSKGLRKGDGSRKGTFNSRLTQKETWKNKIRVQRAFLQLLKDKLLIDQKTYVMLKGRAKGGFFRNKKHLKGYIQENKLFLAKK